MTEKDLINRLNELKRVKPDQNWVIFCRENLIREMGGNAAPGRSVLSRIVGKIRGIGEIREIGEIEWIKGGLLRGVLRPAAVLAGVFVLIFGNGLWAVFMAKASLPGDRLYPVKIALEQARLLMAPSQEGKTMIQSDIIASRLQELDRVVNAGEPLESKQPKIEEAVSNLQKQLLTVKEELPKLENLEPKKVVEMAKKIDANAAQVQDALNQTKLALSAGIKQNLSERINEASDEADKTSNKALEMMIKQQAQGNGETHKEILAKLDGKIQKTQGLMESLEAAVKSAAGKEFSINASLILDETDRAIEQAKISLREDDVQGALQTIKTADELVKSAKKIVEAADISDADKNSDAADADTATSTAAEP